MSWSVSMIGRDKEKLKARVREQQVKDPANNPHSGIPARTADIICGEIDRVKVYQHQGKTFGLRIDGNGSFHEQGYQETLRIDPVELVE